MTEEQPWRDRDRLAALLRGWRRHAGSDLFRVLAGDGWLELRLAGDERRSFFFAALAGATLLCDVAGPLPRNVRAALPEDPRPPCGGHLDGARFTGAGIMPDDLVAALRLERRNGEPAILLCQMFGARGNATLLDPSDRLLWALHRPPHPALIRGPRDDDLWSAGPAAAPAAGDGGEAVHRGGGRVARRCRRLGLQRLARALEETLAGRLNARVRRRLKQQRRLVANLERDLVTADAGESVRRDAEALAAHLHLWRPGLERLDVADPRDGQPRQIPLDPARDAAANLDRLFKEARRAERGRDLIDERLATARHDLATLLEAERTLAEACRRPAAAEPEGAGDPQLRTELATPRLDALLAWRETEAELVAPPRRAAGAGPEEPARPFRRYRLAGRWEVWIGRSAAENDLLTHRHAALRDIWFHAQGVTGSHVVLRTGGRPDQVPQRIIAQAAALAALHSKSRHAGIVPVIYTERRYVRRPRKSPPGTATCLRHESLFVEPGVPEGAEAV
jgi:predicted ribosome quality control (RQC) complex YloA/Tae2 family protein